MWMMEDACVPNWVPSKLLLLGGVGRWDGEVHRHGLY